MKDKFFSKLSNKIRDFIKGLREEDEVRDFLRKDKLFSFRFRSDGILSSSKEVCKKTLKRYDFKQARRRSSYILMQKRVENTTITVPIPDHKELKRGTLTSIIRQSGIPKEESEK